MASSNTQVNVNEAKEATEVSRKVLNAVRKLQGRKGISLADLKKYLRDVRKMDVVEADGLIKLALKRGVNRGDIQRTGGGNYKIGNPKRRSSGRRRGGNRSRGGNRAKGRKGGRGRQRGRSASRRRSSRSRKRGASNSRQVSAKRRSRRRRNTASPDDE